MDDKNFAQLSSRLETAALVLPYPRTPDLSREFLTPRRRQQSAVKLGWAVAALLAVLASTLVVPSVRARVLEFLQVGAVRILQGDALVQNGQITPYKEKHNHEREVIISVLELDGETTLEQARADVNFPIDLPTYPADLGEPDRVFLQHMDTGDFVVLAWLDAAGEPRVVEYVIGPGVYLLKGTPNVVQETLVNGSLAVWARGQYLLHIDGFHQPVQFVSGPALIWTRDKLTYRLEAPLSLAEMVRIAESVGE